MSVLMHVYSDNLIWSDHVTAVSSSRNRYPHIPMSSKQLNKPDDHLSLPGSKAEVTTLEVTAPGWTVITCGLIVAMATDRRTQRKTKVLLLHGTETVVPV